MRSLPAGCISRSVVVNRDNGASRGHWGILEGTAGIQWVEAMDVARHPTMPRTSPTTENSPALRKPILDEGSPKDFSPWRGPDTGNNAPFLQV